MRQVKINKKRITALALSMMLVLQQSFALQVLATTITNADGSTIAGDNGTWNISPDAVNESTGTGFKQFDKIDLSDGDVLNFIYSYIKNREAYATWNSETNTHDGHYTASSNGTIDTFINLVNNGVNINGIVNALQSVGGDLKTNGNLMFITPNGFMVGASGVINVGNLSVITPTQPSYNTLKDYLDLPSKQPGLLVNVKVVDDSRVEGGHYAFDLTYDDNYKVSNATDKNVSIDSSNKFTYNGNNELTIGTDPTKQYIVNNGRILTRAKDNYAGQGVRFQGGYVDISKTTSGNDYTGVVLTGVNDSTKLTTNSAAQQLFETLVNASDTNSANSYNAKNGAIYIDSTVGTNIGEGTHIRNLAKNSEIGISNTGDSGINIAGNVYNYNSDSAANEWLALTIDNNNSTSGLNIAQTADIRNNGEGYIMNSGSNGLTISGKVLNNVNNMEITNSNGQLLVNPTGIITTNTTDSHYLQVTNSGSDGMDIQGKFINTSAQKLNTVKFTNSAGDMKIGHSSNI